MKLFYALMAAQVILTVLPGTVAAKDAPDPLSLEADPPTPNVAAPASRAFLEFAGGTFRERGATGSTRGFTRVTADARVSGKLGNSWRAILSARIDALDPNDTRIDSPALSLREAYLGWQDASGESVIEFGRVVVRDGPGYGYNPTDFFRDNALRAINTQDPVSLRESRLGSVMLRAQRLWNGGSLAVSLSPKLATSASARGLSLDLGATNSRNRGLLALSTTWNERISTQLLLYREESLGWSFGTSATALLGEAVVVHAEMSDGRAPGTFAGSETSGTRAAVGLTLTTPTKLSVTAEYHYNASALDRKGWSQSLVTGTPPLPVYYGASFALQDSGSRHAWLLYAVQRDFIVKNLEIRGIYRNNRSDSSSMRWLEVRYRLTGADIGMQYLRNSGTPGSEFGLPSSRSSASVFGTVYF